MNFKELTASYKEEMLINITNFCGIDSTYDEKSISQENPFGKGVTEALKFFENLARKDGFRVNNYANKVVEVLVGSGKKNITIMGHADVVPAGEGWETDPFKVVTKDGYLIGRGVADDKGPTLSCYYALKALRDNNLLGDYTVRFLVGGNEERGSACMEYYFQDLNMPAPTYGFSPDASFPVIYAEKGIMGFKATIKAKVPGLISIKGGVAFNAVISRCNVKFVKDEKFLNFVKRFYPNTIIDDKNDYYDMTFIGKAAHGSIPWEGFNAGMHALNIIAGYTRVKELEKALSYFADKKGFGLRANSHSDDMGDNSLNVGFISYENETLTLAIDFRHVNTSPYEETKAKIIKNAPEFKIEFGGYSRLLYYPKDSTLVSTLLNAYREETGDNSEPIAIGGGTYAKETDNVVAFGLEFPGVDAKMHAPGENIKIDHLVLGMSIYAKAIYDLGKKIENEN